MCREPWQSYYILRRGILPCCYGHQPIAPMSEWKTAWNSAVMQEIRRALARGTLSDYCRMSLSCPIVQRHTAEAARLTQENRSATRVGRIRVAISRLSGRIFGLRR